MCIRDRNETMALVGESGSGKSVSAMSILQLLPEGKTIFSEDSSIKFQHAEILEMSNKQLQSIRGKKISMIFITHDIKVAQVLCDRVYILCDGQIVEHGETQKVLSNPRHNYTSELIEAVY